MENKGCLWIALLFGLPFFLIGLLAGYNEYTFFTNATETTEGIVIDVASEASKKGTSYTYRCYYSYTTKSGERLTCRDAKSTKPALYDIGDKVILYYNPSEPEKAAPLSFWGTWLLPFAFTFVGFCVILSGVLAEKWLEK
jgi:Protein of unknown function (DUF3592)